MFEYFYIYDMKLLNVKMEQLIFKKINWIGSQYINIYLALNKISILPLCFASSLQETSVWIQWFFFLYRGMAVKWIFSYVIGTIAVHTLFDLRSSSDTEKLKESDECYCSFYIVRRICRWTFTICVSERFVDFFCFFRFGWFATLLL